jgi:proteic killer suppression protein
MNLAGAKYNSLSGAFRSSQRADVAKWLLDKCKLSFYNQRVITSFRHRGLRRLYEKDDAARVPAQDLRRIRLILTALDAAQSAKDLDIHTFRLHPLKGDLKGFWAITVRANWRIIFRFDRGNVCDVDLVDYH